MSTHQQHSKRCNQTANIPELSIFTATSSAIICIAASLINILLMFIFKKNASFFKRRSSFYGLLLNIVLADLCTGIMSSGFSIYFHIKEALGEFITELDSKILHCTILIINGASVFTMSLLCVERMLALVKPYWCGKNTGATTKLVVVAAGTWLIPSLLIIPYFRYGYIRYLLFFSATTVLLAFVFLLTTTFVYKNYFDSNHNKSSTDSGKQIWKTESESLSFRKHCHNIECSHQLHNCLKNTSKRKKNGDFEIAFEKRFSKKSSALSTHSTENRGFEKQPKWRFPIMRKLRSRFIEKLGENRLNNKAQCCSCHVCSSANNTRSSSSLVHIKTIPATTASPKRNTKRSEQRIHRSFLAMLVVFLATYLPAVLMIVYMNLCRRCSCTLVHALRDLTTLTIMASSFFRPLNFVLTLKTLRKAISQVFKQKQKQNYNSYFKSVSSDFLDSYPGSPVRRLPGRCRIVTI